MKKYLPVTAAVLFSLAVFLLVKLKAMLSPVFAAFLLTYIAFPFVKKLSTKIPAPLAALSFYLILAVTVGILTAFILPSVLKGLVGLSEQISSLSDMYFISKDNLVAYISEKSDSIRLFLTNALSYISKAAVAVVLSCFLLADIKSIKETALSLVPSSLRIYLMPAVREIDKIFRDFFISQLLSSVILAFITFITLILLKINYAAVLSLFYGIFCLIPTIGPFIGAIPLVAIAYLQAPSAALFALSAVILTQVLDNTVISPKLKADSVDISPAAAFMALYFGAGLFGLAGVILSVPVYASLKVILRRLLSAIV